MLQIVLLRRFLAVCVMEDPLECFYMGGMQTVGVSIFLFIKSKELLGQQYYAEFLERKIVINIPLICLEDSPFSGACV